MKKIALALILMLVPCLAFAAQVSLIWDAPDAATPQGYRIYWGTESGVYSHTKDVGNVLTATIDGLDMGVTYYFAATALYEGGIESGYSNEASKAIPWAPPPQNVTVTGISMNLHIDLTP